ncbi:MAG: DUF4065 domain-containing protein [Candidatus Izemoplasmatales bacterium]
MNKGNEQQLCLMCMKEHPIKIVEEKTINIFKNEEIEYNELMLYCDNTDEYYIPEDLIKENDKNMKDAYRQKVGLLESTDIINIRKTYNMSQKDMARILGWSESTITRYETHQVQDNAHDSILRKIMVDPNWLKKFLEDNKAQLSDKAYAKYKKNILKQIRQKEDYYLIQSLETAHLSEDITKYNGDSTINVTKVIDIINYIGNQISYVYLVKLMKMLWYIDNLSYKLRNKSITGMVYYKYPMGAVPNKYKLIMELKGVSFDEVDFQTGKGTKLIKNPKYTYKELTKEDIKIIDKVIEKFKYLSSDECIDKMHNEKAYIKTKDNKPIPYTYAKEINIK